MKWLKVNPVVLILINIIAPSMYIFIKGSYLQYFLFMFTILLLILMGRFKNMFMLVLVWIGFVAGGYYSVKYGIFDQVGVLLTVMAQTLPCMALAIILIKKYSSAQLLSALETLHIPRPLVIAVTITLKYIPTFKREFGYITESMRLREIDFSVKKPFRSFKFFIVPQLFRCAALAEEVTSAGLVKGIDAPVRRSSYYEERIRVSDVMVFASFALGIIGGFVWQKKF